MQQNSPQWSDTEQKITHEALNKAYARETEALMVEIREKASQISQINDIWSLNDYLSAKRYDIDGKYDYRDATPFFILATLIKQGWLKPDELAGLTPDKRAKVAALARM
jgi:Photoprotection regulator fluorescence recovery protein